MRLTYQYLGILLTLLYVFAAPGFAVEPMPAGSFSDDECISCHSQHSLKTVAQWRNGPHGPASKTNCSDCHGKEHIGSAAMARTVKTCTNCHVGPTSDSYATSKHGIIVRLENTKQDWGKPLQRGAYRAPSCSYCHLNDGDHGDSMAIGGDSQIRQGVCISCHSPRYVRELFSSGERQLKIADLKLAEGLELIMGSSLLPNNKLEKLGFDLHTHQQNIRLGIGHQSPDYQWWHGQPAMDGDLIRIKDIISKSRRTEALHK